MATKRKLEKARARRKDFVKRHNKIKNLSPLEKAKAIFKEAWQPRSRKIS